jgi:hypothetical protein
LFISFHNYCLYTVNELGGSLIVSFYIGNIWCPSGSNFFKLLENVYNNILKYLRLSTPTPNPIFLKGTYYSISLWFTMSYMIWSGLVWEKHMPWSTLTIELKLDSPFHNPKYHKRLPPQDTNPSWWCYFHKTLASWFALCSSDWTQQPDHILVVAMILQLH